AGGRRRFTHAVGGRLGIRSGKSHLICVPASYSPKKLPVNSPLLLQPAAPCSQLPPTFCSGSASFTSPSVWSTSSVAVEAPCEPISEFFSAFGVALALFLPPPFESPLLLPESAVLAVDSAAAAVSAGSPPPPPPPTSITLIGASAAALSDAAWPERPIRKPTPTARTSVATPAIRAALAFIRGDDPPPGDAGGGGGVPPPGGAPSDSMKTSASMNGRRGSPRRCPQLRQ